MALLKGIKSVKAECRCILYQWANEEITPDLTDSELSASRPLELSPFVSSFSYEKDNGGAFGSFRLTLENSIDWSEHIRPGMWLNAYLGNDGGLNAPSASSGSSLPRPSLEELKQKRKYLRCIGFVEDVRTRASLTVSGALEIFYEISGRDYGVAYTADIFQNFFRFSSSLIDSATSLLQSRSTQTVDSLVRLLHDLFMLPSALPHPGGDKGIEFIGHQFLWPAEMIQALGLKLRNPGLGTYFGNIDGLLDSIEPSPATFPVDNPLSSLSGECFERLKQFSVSQFHELFVELKSDGAPGLHMRLIPFKLSGKAYPTIAPSVKSLLDLEAVKVPTIDILSFEIGRSNTERFNLFYCITTDGNLRPFDNISQLSSPSAGGRIFPYIDLNSVKRSGLLKMQVEIQGLIQLGLNIDHSDEKALLEWNEYLLEMHSQDFKFESGSIELVGNNDVRIGKAFIFDDSAPFNAGKIGYIENYSDNYSVDEMGCGSWEQSLRLTRIVDKATLVSSLGALGGNLTFSKRANPFKEIGTFVGK